MRIGKKCLTFEIWSPNTGYQKTRTILRALPLAISNDSIRLPLLFALWSEIYSSFVTNSFKSAGEQSINFIIYETHQDNKLVNKIRINLPANKQECEMMSISLTAHLMQVWQSHYVGIWECSYYLNKRLGLIYDTLVET